MGPNFPKNGVFSNFDLANLGQTQRDRWTGLTRHFVHLKTIGPAKDPILLLTAILADATNLGLGKSTLEPLVGGSINTKLIERQFGDVIRLAASIRQGTVTASLILRKLGSYPHQNSLALALRQVGKIERTLFMLEWLRDPALRRRVTAGLNKGETHNALARAVCFNRLGEIRDRSFENQRHRASGLNLLVAAKFPFREVAPI